MNVFGVITNFLKQAVKFIDNALVKFFDKVIIPIFSRYFVHASIFVGVTVIFILSFRLEITNGRAKGYLDIDFWLDNLIPNIIADMIGILLTTFIIAGLFSRNTKLNEQKELYNLIGSDFNDLMNTLCNNYLYLLKREEKFLSSEYHIRRSKSIEEFINITRDTSSMDISKITEPLYLKKMEPIIIYEVNEKGFISMIPRLQSYLEELLSNERERKELSRESDRIKLHLKEIELSNGKESVRYREKLSDFEEIEQKVLQNLERAEQLYVIRGEFEKFEAREVAQGFTNFFNNKVNEFYNKYNFLIPMDMRLSFSQLEKEFKYLSTWIWDYEWNYQNSKKPVEERADFVRTEDYEESQNRMRKFIRRSISNSSEDIRNLLTYFDKVGYRKYLP